MKDTLVDMFTVDKFASAFPSLSAQTVNGLKAELTRFKAAVDDVDPSVDVHDWWQRHEQRLPHWSTAFFILVKSAAAGSIFTVETLSISDNPVHLKTI